MTVCATLAFILSLALFFQLSAWHAAANALASAGAEAKLPLFLCVNHLYIGGISVFTSHAVCSRRLLRYCRCRSNTDLLWDFIQSHYCPAEVIFTYYKILYTWT
jgi:hypothetical protein